MMATTRKFLLVLMIGFLGITLTSCFQGNNYSDYGGFHSNYSLTGESLSQGYGGSYTYRATLTNLSSESYNFGVTLHIYDSSGRSIASSSKRYVLASGGSTTVLITLMAGNTASTYEATVSGHKV